MRARFAVFIISSAVLGLVGGFYVGFYGGVSPNIFSFDTLLLLLAMIVVGRPRLGEGRADRHRPPAVHRPALERLRSSTSDRDRDHHARDHARDDPRNRRPAGADPGLPRAPPWSQRQGATRYHRSTSSRCTCSERVGTRVEGRARGRRGDVAGQTPVRHRCRRSRSACAGARRRALERRSDREREPEVPGPGLRRGRRRRGRGLEVHGRNLRRSRSRGRPLRRRARARERGRRGQGIGRRALAHLQRPRRRRSARRPRELEERLALLREGRRRSRLGPRLDRHEVGDPRAGVRRAGAGEMLVSACRAT